MEIRDLVGKELGAVYRLVESAFGEPSEADLIVALEKSGDIEISLVMEDKGRLIGHILFSRLQALEGSLALAPVSVSPDRQNSGVGSAFIHAGIEPVGVRCFCLASRIITPGSVLMWPRPGNSKLPFQRPISWRWS
jgi:putative acetyltransferase